MAVRIEQHCARAVLADVRAALKDESLGRRLARNRLDVALPEDQLCARRVEMALKEREAAIAAIERDGAHRDVAFDMPKAERLVERDRFHDVLNVEAGFKPSKIHGGLLPDSRPRSG